MGYYGWEPDWNNDDWKKFEIENDYDELYKDAIKSIHRKNKAKSYEEVFNEIELLKTECEEYKDFEKVILNKYNYKLWWEEGHILYYDFDKYFEDNFCR